MAETSSSTSSCLPDRRWYDHRIQPSPTSSTHDRLYSEIDTNETISRRKAFKNLCSSIEKTFRKSKSGTTASTMKVDFDHIPETGQSNIKEGLLSLYRFAQAASWVTMTLQLEDAKKQQKVEYGKSTRISEDRLSEVLYKVHFSHVLQTIHSVVSQSNYRTGWYTFGKDRIRKELDRSLLSGMWSVEFTENTITGTLATCDLEDDQRNRRESKVVFDDYQSVDMVCESGRKIKLAPR